MSPPFSRFKRLVRLLARIPIAIGYRMALLDALKN
jgi:hypothetical protein